MSTSAIVLCGNINNVLFSAVFALYFGANIASSRSFHAFDTAAVAACDLHALCRLVLGVLLLNIIPFGYYLWVGDLLAKRPSMWPIDITVTHVLDCVLILMLGTVGAGFYRIFAAIMMCQGRDGVRFRFYAPRDMGEICATGVGSHKDYNSSGFYTGPGNDVIRKNISAAHHFWGSFLYFVPPVVLYWCLTK